MQSNKPFPASCLWRRLHFFRAKLWTKVNTANPVFARKWTNVLSSWNVKWFFFVKQKLKLLLTKYYAISRIKILYRWFYRVLVDNNVFLCIVNVIEIFFCILKVWKRRLYILINNAFFRKKCSNKNCRIQKYLFADDTYHFDLEWRCQGQSKIMKFLNGTTFFYINWLPHNILYKKL